MHPLLQNIKCVNDNLIELRDYIGYVCTSMTAFCDLHKDKTTYTKFCEDIETRRAVLAVYKESLDSLRRSA
jgi:UV DNA damage repair endonuclease